MKRAPPSDSPTSLGVLGLLLSLAVGGVLFVVLWAGLNFAFGTALDGPIGAWIMEAPCQRLAGNEQPLTSYVVGRGRAATSVCHFATGPLRVTGPTEDLGFSEREFIYLALGLVGYAVCFVCALVLTVLLVRAGRKLFTRAQSAQ